MAHQFIFTVSHLRKVSQSGKEIIKDLTLAFLPGAKIGVIGGNGAGKSTLLRIMAGVDSSFHGETWHPPEVRIGFLPQEPVLDEGLDVRGNVMLAVAPVKRLLDRFDELNVKMAEELSPDEMEKVMTEYGKVQDAIEAAGAWDLDRKIDIAMDALRCPPGDADVRKISGGERRRVALCRVLLEQPDLLLLDEPTNHLDAESVAWLEHHL
ncbi:MAG TPA: ATP-binding cassette domain-containing protein, partial [Myxococcota bacterium]|nr:ATP-binding cassette domain-containing protein [Myxococcota bacterium]